MKFTENHFSRKKAFTLIEILVGIAIIFIITLGVSQVDFNRLSQKQKISITAAEIISKIEGVRDAALTGKGVGNPLVTPNSWSLEFNTTGSGVLLATYDTGAINSFSASNWKSDGKTVFSRITCERLDGSSGALIGTGRVQFIDTTLILSGCPNAYDKKLIIELFLSPFKEIVEFNTVNGVVSRK